MKISTFIAAGVLAFGFGGFAQADNSKIETGYCNYSTAISAADRSLICNAQLEKAMFEFMMTDKIHIIFSPDNYPIRWTITHGPLVSNTLTEQGVRYKASVDVSIFIPEFDQEVPILFETRGDNLDELRHNVAEILEPTYIACSGTFCSRGDYLTAPVKQSYILEQCSERTWSCSLHFDANLQIRWLVLMPNRSGHMGAEYREVDTKYAAFFTLSDGTEVSAIHMPNFQKLITFLEAYGITIPE